MSAAVILDSHSDLESYIPPIVFKLGLPYPKLGNDHARPYLRGENFSLMFERVLGGLRGVSCFLKGLVHQADAENSYRHANDGSDAHRAGPSGRDQLGLKIVFIMLILAGGIKVLADARSDFVARKTGTSLSRAYFGGVMVILAVIGGIALIQALPAHSVRI